MPAYKIKDTSWLEARCPACTYLTEIYHTVDTLKGRGVCRDCGFGFNFKVKVTACDIKSYASKEEVEKYNKENTNEIR